MDLDKLNKEQREAVVHTEGPLLIFAGAGSGKTRVLTHRIAYLIEEKGVYPSNILAITFTNKAAREMKERVDKLMDTSASNMWISTFHSACAKILRMNIERLTDYKKNFVIFDSDDQEKIVKECLKELNYNEKNFPPRNVLSVISRSKDQMITAEKFMERNMSDFKMRKFADIYKLYQDKLKKNNALDFDDILLKTVELLAYNEDILKHYQDKFKYIMVDEYQDTNYCQYKLISLLARQHKNLCVVGDDDQCIYSWRGADIGNILNFEKDFSGAKVIKLEQNYRSTKTILDAANHVIKCNYGRKSKNLWTENGEGKSVIHYNASDEREEADFITSEIERLSIEESRENGDFAVLYRTNAQSRIIEEMCMTRGIPYKIVGGFKFYDRKEVKDIIAYLRVIQNPTGDLSIKRIINVPKRGIGIASIEKLENHAKAAGDSLFDALLELDEIEGINAKAKKNMREFYRLIVELMAMSESLSISELLKEVLERSGYLKELEEGEDEATESRADNIRELLSAAIEFEKKNEDKTLESFLEKLALMSDIDNLDSSNSALTMMTLHSAKGLEYPVVFIAGMEEGLFPSQRSYFEDKQMEEERRLMYVGITRAKEKLYLTSAFERTIYGHTTYTTVSQFVKEIPKDLITRI